MHRGTYIVLYMFNANVCGMNRVDFDGNVYFKFKPTCLYPL